MELDKLNARIEMLIELVEELNEDNTKLNNSVAVLTEKVTVLESMVSMMDKSIVTNTTTTADWSKIFNTIAAGNTCW